MQVENHVLTLHLFEDRVESFVRNNAGSGVGGHASWVRLDASNAGFLCLNNSLRRDVGVKVERHEESDIRRQTLQALLVLESMLRSRDRRNQVWLHTKCQFVD